jgi:hypothetical protein
MAGITPLLTPEQLAQRLPKLRKQAAEQIERECWQPHAFECSFSQDPTRCHRWFKWLGGDAMCGLSENHEIHSGAKL